MLTCGDVGMIKKKVASMVGLGIGVIMEQSCGQW